MAIEEDNLGQAVEFIRLALSKTMEMHEELQSFFSMRIGPQQLAGIRAGSGDSIPFNPEKEGREQLTHGILNALEKTIEIQLELSSAFTLLQGRLSPESGHRLPES